MYDLTLAYSDMVPQTEKDILRGNFPRTVNFHIVRWPYLPHYNREKYYEKLTLIYFYRYPLENVPSGQGGLQSWINERWREKENRLADFERAGKFPGSSYVSDMDTPLYLAFVVWTTLLFSMFYLFFTSTFFFWWTIFHVCLFIGISYWTLGYQTICVSVREYLIGEKKTNWSGGWPKFWKTRDLLEPIILIDWTVVSLLNEDWRRKIHKLLRSFWRNGNDSWFSMKFWIELPFGASEKQILVAALDLRKILET